MLSYACRYPGVLLMLLSCSCAHTVRIPTERLPEVLAIAEGRTVVLEDDGRTYTVGPEQEPRLVLERDFDCDFFERLATPADCVNPTVLDLDEVRAEGAQLHYEVLRGGSLGLLNATREPVVVPYGSIRSLALRFDDPDKRAHGGIGVSVLGPARFVGFQAQWIAVEWLAIDGGLSFAPDLGAFVWAGMRLRPVAFGSLRPFVGAFVNHASLQTGAEDAGEVAIERELTLGPRLGADLSLSRHVLLTIEADLLYRDEPRVDWLGSGTSAHWITSSGVAVSYLF